MSILHLLAQSITFTLLLLSTTGFLGRLHKYLELTSHFRAQYLIASATCFLIFILMANWWCAAGSLICAVINLSAIAPFYRLKKFSLKNEVKGRHLKLAFANVERCNTEYHAFIALVRRHEPDIVIVQEVDLCGLIRCR